MLSEDADAMAGGGEDIGRKWCRIINKIPAEWDFRVFPSVKCLCAEFT